MENQTEKVNIFFVGEGEVVKGQKKKETDLGVVEMGDGLDDGTSALNRIARLEDTGSHKHPVASEQHHESSICGGSHSSCREVH